MEFTTQKKLLRQESDSTIDVLWSLKILVILDPDAEKSHRDSTEGRRYPLVVQRPATPNTPKRRSIQNTNQNKEMGSYENSDWTKS